MSYMGTTEACKICGKWFTKKRHNQKYCCDKCKAEAEKRRKQRLYFNTVKPQKREKCAPPSITIEGMVDIMLKLSKERGYIVQYGEVQRLLLTGKIKVKDGVRGNELDRCQD